ncbi:MAG: pyrimidine 5'-nucleotidase [Mariprofundaceae bacterium]|nr:pyrimidine 5'-nucleotidase [Mariprofundaceae bacterium]
MSFDLVVVDLDNTLYTADSGVFARMDARMTAFVARELAVDETQANVLRLRYWKRYGTTLRGLILHHDIEPEGFLHEVHDIGVHEMLEQDAALDAALAALPGRKVIHTNGSREHATRVLDALGVGRHFSHIYDIRFAAYTPKPCAATLGSLLCHEDVVAQRTLVIDDMQENLAAARDLGAQTALICAGGSVNGWDYHAENFVALCEKIHTVV